MLKLNKAEYTDKLHACWIGKNIGGTLGAPYEGCREFVDVKGFVTESNAPLPNDDLDLQLAWLNAVEETGCKKFNTNVLADYWLDWIPPYWNEYGICKTNLSMGLLPPMSGEVDNDKWKTSNGAWIRSEIWAALAPGVPDVAVRNAVADAMVDHGISEGTCAEIFTACLQSLAYTESDIRKLIDGALSKIPENSMTAKTIRLVIDCYEKGIPYRETRERIIEFNKELGWFQAPANLGYVTIGLLYGEGDYKNSVIYAVSCGDDTDCTGATVGATLGIIGGTKAIPEDWKAHIGDRILTVALNGEYAGSTPKTCAELTERVTKLVEPMLKENGVAFMFTDDATDYPEEEKESCNRITSEEFLARSPYSYDITNDRRVSVRVEMDKTPRVSAGDERNIKLTFLNTGVLQMRKLCLRMILPETWGVGNYAKTVHLPYRDGIQRQDGKSATEFKITVGEKLESVNRVYVEVTCPTLPHTVIVPIVFLG